MTVMACMEHLFAINNTTLMTFIKVGKMTAVHCDKNTKDLKNPLPYQCTVFVLLRPI